MNSTLTVSLDDEVLALAEQQAQALHTTLTEVIRHQLNVMARNWKDSRAGKTPITDNLRGSVKLPPDFDAQKILAEELQKKHRHGHRG
jgi:hypothetical protein